MELDAEVIYEFDNWLQTKKIPLKANMTLLIGIHDKDAYTAAMEQLF